MIDTSASMLDAISKTSQADKSRAAGRSSPNGSKDFSGYMEASSEKTSSEVEKNKDALDDQSSNTPGSEDETDQQQEQGSPVATNVIDNPDKTREKIANLLMQRASILEKLSNTQDALSQKQLAAVEKVISLDQVSDSLISKLIEKLSLDKTKGELNFQSRLMAEKNLVNLDTADNAINRIVTEGLDKGNLLNSLNSSDRLQSATLLQQMKMSTPVNSADWGTEFGKRIQMLIKGNIQHAEIRLDPPELGRINIRLSITQDQANISFSALNANVREAIEGSMNRLREMLAESGLQLGEANVASEFQQKSNQRTDERDLFAGSVRNKGADEESDIGELPGGATQYDIDGVIDYFA